MNPLMASESTHRHARTALSVNLNKVATLRNTRHLGIPSLVRAATAVLEAGAQGVTVHPRPDERHIRLSDVHEIAALLEAWPTAEFNIEGNPFHNLMDLVKTFRPQQCTFVPDSVGQFTSDHGWNLPEDAERLRPVIAEAHEAGARVSLFMDPIPEAMALAREVGADRVELYTEPYAAAHGTPRAAEQLARFAAAAQAALAAGLGVNAGHDLNRDNLTDFLRAVPGVLEVSIGHALIADALELGYAATVRDYLRCIDRGVFGRRRVIYGIGTDICDIRRIRQTLQRRGDRFAEKVLGPHELKVYHERLAKVEARGVSYLATRFSAKEAFSKAIGMGMRMPMTWRRCEIVKAPSGKPQIELHGELAAWFAARRLIAHVTVTDETDYAAAFVVVEVQPAA